MCSDSHNEHADYGAIVGCTRTGGTCSDSYLDGSSVTLTATPSNSTITCSGGGCSGSSTSCVVTMNAEKNVTVTFSKIQHTVTVVKGGTGSGTVRSSPAGISCGATCSALFDDGTSVMLTATADSGSTFAGWSGGGCSGTGPTCQVTMSADENVTATFTAQPPVVVTGAASNITQTGATIAGTVNPNAANVTDCHFDYGIDKNYGSSVPCSPSPGSGSGAVSVSASLSGLSAGTLYHFRLVASNGGGTAYGNDATFTTTASSGGGGTTTCPQDLSKCHPHLHLNGGWSWVGSNGFLRVKCSDDLGGTCSGKLTFKAVIKVKTKKGKKKRTITVGTASYSLAANSTGSLKLTLTSAAKSALAKSALTATVTSSVDGNLGTVAIPKAKPAKKRKRK